MAKDLYEILGVSKDADEAAVKAAYRKLAIKYHPDRYANASAEEKKQAEDRFKEINHAYEVLSDANKRANYDQYGSEDGPQGFGGFGGEAGGQGFGGFEDILNSFFGGGFGGRNDPNAPQQGEDIQARVDLTFEEAYFGATKDVHIRRDEVCDDCRGSGMKKGGTKQKCPYCQGSGYIVREQRTLFGRQQVRTVCSHCGGSGQIIDKKDRCTTCGGAGVFKNKPATVQVNVPAGMDSGMKMRLRGKGGSGVNGGPSGDLYIVFYVKESPIFHRVGNDLYMDVPVTFLQAAMGCELQIKTMKETVKCNVPAGTQSGTKIRKSGYGMKDPQREKYGDLYLTIRVETPKELTKSQIKLLREFDDSLDANQYPQVSKFAKR